MERTLGAILIVILVFFTKASFQKGQVLGEETTSKDYTLSINQPITTQTRFSEKLEEKTEIIPKKTIVEDDPKSEIGTEIVIDEGEDGKVTKIIKITYYDGDYYNTEVISFETIPPKDKKIQKGTKIIWRELDTPEGVIKYWRKMRVWATHYDSRCLGCNEWTAIGLRAGKGVIAVDPKVIKLRSKVYIPGYGVAVAGDTGGSIKGNIIDLGFEDTRTAGWSAKFIDIYLL